MRNICLKKLTNSDIEEFKSKIQEAFSITIKEEFGEKLKELPIIPTDKELENALNRIDNDSYCIYQDDEKIGGAIVKINNETQINSLELFFINKGMHGTGLGLSAWRAIESQYPDTKIWQTVTPYFEKRNINFYVNKCGFKIIEYCNKYHKCPIEHCNKPKDSMSLGEDDFFVFQKIM